MGVDGDDLLLVGRELLSSALKGEVSMKIESSKTVARDVGIAYLESDDHDVRLADEANNDGALLDGLSGVFDLKVSALRRAGWS